jgi:pyruvate,water dikinase
MTVLENARDVSAGAVVLLRDARDARCCGRKAAALAELIRAGIHVPDGFVLPVGPDPDVSEVEAALGRLGDVPVAVRSSGVLEDLEEQSHAGHYESFLDVRGAPAVLAAAARCRASANGSPMAVLVQALVRADTAGVAFSANPLTGDRDEARVSAVKGLGDRLAAGISDGDEWSVRNGEARSLACPLRALSEADALRVAALARRVETLRGAPQDIEWAMEGGRLLLLQARPITALPVRPDIQVPSGTWQKDASHFPEPITPFAASTHLADEGFFDPALEEWGLLPEGVLASVIGHELYVHVEPDDGGSNPPPWWVLALVARTLPSLRRKLRRAREAVEGGLLESLPREWEASLKPHLQAELDVLIALDLRALGDADLFGHVDQLRALMRRTMRLHFRLDLPHVLGLHELAAVCREALGWDVPRSMQLLRGLSVTSSAPTRSLAEVARRAAERPEARAVVEARGADVMEGLERVAPEVAAALREWLGVWGLRTFGSDAGRRSVAEQPEIVAGMLADLLDGDARLELGDRARLLADARADIQDPALRRKFDEALAYAERVYPLREDNVLLTEQLPVGLLRRAGLEIGRRLVARGVLEHAEDVFMLAIDELRASMMRAAPARGGVGSVPVSTPRDTARRRRAELLWVKANPGPPAYGPPPGRMPDLRGLPDPARRVNEAMLWQLEQELAPAQAADGDELIGIAASAGVYRGTVRVIRSVEGLGRLRTGEVLVCPATSSAWMMVFHRAGALVTDHGSALSHTAIVAREHGLPAVVATGSATTRLRDGEEVIVDGQRGTVRRMGWRG